MRPAQDRQRIKAQGPSMTDLLHKHVVRTEDKEGNQLRTEYNFVPADVLGNVGYHAEPNWCATCPKPSTLTISPQLVCHMPQTLNPHEKPSTGVPHAPNPQPSRQALISEPSPADVLGLLGCHAKSD